MRTKRTRCGRDRDAGLQRQLPFLSICSDAELGEAKRLLTSLAQRSQELCPGDRVYLALLADRVARYEEDTLALPTVLHQELLRHVLEAFQLTTAEVASATGIADATLCEVLAGWRRLPRTKVRRLVRFFQIPSAAFAGKH
jgi:antitoxin component HigA of HigAB toxin-antitoxin module